MGEKREDYRLSSTDTSFHGRFSDSGGVYIGDTLYFKSNYPDTCTFLWNFGDGDTAMSARPSHIFSNQGDFAVSLTLNGDTLHKITGRVGIFAGSWRVSGTLSWHRYAYSSVSGQPVYTHLNDTVFGVWGNTDTSVQVWGQKLFVYYNTFWPQQVLFSAGNYSTYGFPGYSIRYNYSNDSIYFMDNHSGTAGMVYTLYATKK